VRQVEEPSVRALAPRVPGWVFWVGLLLATGLYLVQGSALTQRMVTWTDESAYVHLSYLVARGQINLFQDEMMGSRMPLPFWILGASQLLWGRSLLAARLTALGIGLVPLALVALLARRLAGNLAGILACLFLATQGVLVGYFATGTYHSTAAAILLGGLALIVFVRRPWGPTLGMAVVSLLFLTRTNLWPIIPGMLLFLLWEARTARERLAVAAAAAVVPVSFFLSDARHLKIVAYVPVVGRLVRFLGYPAGFALVDIPEPLLGDRLWAVIRFARMYEFWMLAVLFLFTAAVVRRLRGLDTGAIISDRHTLLLAATLVYTLLWQVLILWKFPKAVVGWFPSFAPLLPILLGVGFARLLDRRDWGRVGRVVTVAVLATCLLAPIRIIRHPLLVSGVHAHAAPLRDLDAAAAHFRRLVPPGAKVFLWGDSFPLYLAGILPYLRQIHSTNTYALVEDRVAIEKSGLWGRQEMDRWLSTDADFVVVEPRSLDQYRARHPDPMARFDALVREHFVLVDKVEDYPWQVFEVYARRR
jgi:4-amino-4-deoxy-L-arabinose transferase-like glycosyltransferase